MNLVQSALLPLFERAPESSLVYDDAWLRLDDGMVVSQRAVREDGEVCNQHAIRQMDITRTHAARMKELSIKN